jgi:hypothetical protein
MILMIECEGLVVKKVTGRKRPRSLHNILRVLKSRHFKNTKSIITCYLESQGSGCVACI